MPPAWEELYGQRTVAERLSEAARTRLTTETGRDGQWLLDRVAEPSTPAALATLPAVEVLRTVWAQQYEVRDQQLVFQDLRGYDGTLQIQSPHDAEARWSVTFSVADADWVAARTAELGGTVVSGPVDVPYSRVVQITDPQGASVTLSQFKMPE